MRVAVDRGEPGLGAPRDVQAVPRRRERERPRMIGEWYERGFPATERVHEQHAGGARHRDEIAPRRGGDVAPSRDGATRGGLIGGGGAQLWGVDAAAPLG